MSTTGGRSASAAPQSHFFRTTGGRSASAAPQSHFFLSMGQHRNQVIGYDVFEKECLRQGSFAPGNRVIATTGGEIRQRSAAVTFLPMPVADPFRRCPR